MIKLYVFDFASRKDSSYFYAKGVEILAESKQEALKKAKNKAEKRLAGLASQAHSFYSFDKKDIKPILTKEEEI